MSGPVGGVPVAGDLEEAERRARRMIDPEYWNVTSGDADAVRQVLAEYDRRGSELARVMAALNAEGGTPSSAALFTRQAADEFAAKLAASERSREEFASASGRQLAHVDEQRRDLRARVAAALAVLDAGRRADFPGTELSDRVRAVLDGSTGTPPLVSPKDSQTTAPLPSRDDDVAAWIKAARDEQNGDGTAWDRGRWNVLDDLMEDYRAHADYGLPLSVPVHEPPCGLGEECPVCSGSVGTPAALNRTLNAELKVAGPLAEAPALAPTGTEHRYLSTGCLHGRHDYCQAPHREDGNPKRPSQCKFCAAPCVCSCHAATASDSKSDERGGDEAVVPAPPGVHDAMRAYGIDPDTYVPEIVASTNTTPQDKGVVYSLRLTGPELELLQAAATKRSLLIGRFIKQAALTAAVGAAGSVSTTPDLAPLAAAARAVLAQWDRMHPSGHLAMYTAMDALRAALAGNTTEPEATDERH